MIKWPVLSYFMNTLAYIQSQYCFKFLDYGANCTI